MKKLHIFLCLSLLSTSTHPELLNFLDDFDLDEEPTDESSVELSDAQKSQLRYLQDELTKYSDLAQTKWTNDPNIKLLVEIMQDAVKASSPQTKVQMELSIVRIFRKFNIEIFFNASGLIEKVVINPKVAPKPKKKFTPPQQPTASPPSQKSEVHIHAHEHEEKPEHEKKEITLQIQGPLRIHGAGRTLRKLEEERLAQEKQAADEEQKEALRTQQQMLFKKEMLRKFANSQPETHKNQSSDDLEGHGE